MPMRIWLRTIALVAVNNVMTFMQSLRRLNILDWILITVAIAAIGVVGYRYQTQHYFDWLDLVYLAVAILGYSKYRTGQSRDLSRKSEPQKPTTPR
jgi:hypothetical protein